MIAAAGGALLTLGAAYSVGSLATRKTTLSPVLRFAIGAAILSNLIFGLMCLRVAGVAGMLSLGLVCLLPGAFILEWKRPSRRRLQTLLLLIFTAYGVLYLVNALAPEIEADANVYHLRPATEAVRSGGFPREIDFYDQMPQGLEMLFAMAYAIGGSPAARLVHLGFLIASLPLIVQLGRRWSLTNGQATCAAAIYFVTPVVGVSGTAAFNDAGLVFFLLATVAFLAEGRPLLAGIAAGFCYALKMTGIVAVLGGFLWFGLRRRARPLLVFCFVSSLLMAPWLIRNAVQTGNPFAPFGNSLFPNPFFHSTAEQALRVQLRSYGMTWFQRPLEVITGYRLQGIIGPLFLLAPVALLGLLRPEGRRLLALAAFFSTIWLTNAGARFLMPALPFLILAMLLPLPVGAGYALLVLHAVLSWPWVIPYYAPLAWRLHSFPINAAVGRESSSVYLSRESSDYRVARMVEAVTPPDAQILDLWGVHEAYIHRSLLGSWQSVKGERLTRELVENSQDDSFLLSYRAVFAEQLVSSVRVGQLAKMPNGWSIGEISLQRGGAPVRPVRDWILDSHPNPWEAPFALDGNPVSSWRTWAPGHTGDFFSVRFDRPVALGSVVLTSGGSEYNSHPRVELQRAGDGSWFSVDAIREWAPPLNLKAAAVRAMRAEAISHIVVAAGRSGMGVLGDQMVREPDKWGLTVAGEESSVYVFKVR